MKGYRHNGPRKTLLINKANLLMVELGSRGVRMQAVLKHLGIKGDAMSITTKQWSGVIGMLKGFIRDNIKVIK